MLNPPPSTLFPLAHVTVALPAPEGGTSSWLLTTWGPTSRLAEAQMELTVTCRVLFGSVFCAATFHLESLNILGPWEGCDEKPRTTAGVSMSTPPPSTLFPLEQVTVTL